MTGQELWQAFLKKHPHVKQAMNAWQFGVEPDTLAQLVLEGKKTATASAYDLYQIDGEDLPQVGRYDVILDGKDEAVCVIEIRAVSLIPFSEVDERHARKEGEGDLSLAYWRRVHEEFFKPYFEEAGLVFSDSSLIVCEEFEVVYCP